MSERDYVSLLRIAQIHLARMTDLANDLSAGGEIPLRPVRRSDVQEAEEFLEELRSLWR